MRTGEQWFHKGMFGREMDARQPVYSKCLVESSIRYVWSTYCMLTIVVDILYASNSLSANENPMKDCYLFLSPGWGNRDQMKWSCLLEKWHEFNVGNLVLDPLLQRYTIVFFFNQTQLWSQVVLLCKITSLILFSMNCIFSQDAFWRRLYYNLFWIILLSWKLLVIFRVPSYF